MKRVFCLIFAILMVVPTAVSCTSQTEDDPDKINVVATIFPQYDFVRAIAGDSVELEMLLSPESESHTYTPTLADVAMIGNADLFIYTGGGLDTWAEDIVASLGDDNVKSIAISDAVTLACHDESVHDHDHDHDHNHEHDHGGDACVYDEHVWTSPKNAIDIFDYILDALCDADPDNAERYRDRAEAYRDELLTLDAELCELSSTAVRREVIFADRFPFLYLTEEYGLDYHAALSGCSVGEEPTAGVIAELTETVASDGFGYVFVIENSNSKVADLISEATGCGVLTLHSCHTVSDEDYANGVTYVSLMKQNIENLRLALN